MSAAPPPRPLLDRFRHDLERALGAAPAPPLALAVSGGPDSMAMLALASTALPGGVAAATVDHRLRPAGADEAAMVAAHCTSIGVPHATLVRAAPIAGASIQARAREARYALLFDWAARIGASALLTAHHLEDQAETFLMRAARGSGVAGLAAIRERRAAAEAVTIVRPLLHWRRAELRAVAKRCGPFVDDPANADPAHDRTRFRALLAANPWLDAAALAAAAAHLADAEAVLAQAADAAWAAHALAAGATVRIAAPGLPRELARRLVRRAVATVRAADPSCEGTWRDSANVEAMLEALARGSGATLAGVRADHRDGAWHFAPAPPRRSH